jgi:hypothetical protein
MSKYLLILFIIIFLGNCASFWSKRLNDSKDVITLGVEDRSYGLGLRLSYLPIGFFFQGEKNLITNEIDGEGYGLRGGSFQKYHSHQLIYGFLGGESFYSGEVMRDGNGKILTEEKIPIVSQPRDNLKSFSVEYFKIFDDKPKQRQKRNKEKITKHLVEDLIQKNNSPELQSYLPPELKKKNGYHNSYPYQFEISFGVYYAIRFGLNFAEFLDLFLGFFGADILEDDLIELPMENNEPAVEETEKKTPDL